MPPNATNWRIKSDAKIRHISNQFMPVPIRIQTISCICVGITESLMMFFGGAAISSCAILAFFSVLCTAQIQNQNLLYNGRVEADTVNANTVNVKNQSLQCYVCNSEYDPRCADPFDPYTIGIINCSDRKTPEHLMHYVPVVCRKMIQKVEGNVRVIRSCGYVKDEHDDKKCYRRTGTAAVEVIHCSCTKSLCNAGHLSQRPYSSAIFLAVAITLAITNFLGKQSP